MRNFISAFKEFKLKNRTRKIFLRLSKLKTQQIAINNKKIKIHFIVKLSYTAN
jgi:hypothetical protein